MSFSIFQPVPWLFFYPNDNIQGELFEYVEYRNHAAIPVQVRNVTMILIISFCSFDREVKPVREPLLAAAEQLQELKPGSSQQAFDSAVHKVYALLSDSKGIIVTIKTGPTLPLLTSHDISIT